MLFLFFIFKMRTNIITLTSVLDQRHGSVVLYYKNVIEKHFTKTVLTQKLLLLKQLQTSVVERKTVDNLSVSGANRIRCEYK